MQVKTKKTKQQVLNSFDALYDVRYSVCDEQGKVYSEEMSVESVNPEIEKFENMPSYEGMHKRPLDRETRRAFARKQMARLTALAVAGKAQAQNTPAVVNAPVVQNDEPVQGYVNTQGQKCASAGTQQVSQVTLTRGRQSAAPNNVHSSEIIRELCCIQR